MKRGRLQTIGDWPHVFQINDIAKLIVSFLPWLQYQQWIVECNAEMQEQLCRWRHHQCRTDHKIKTDIVLKNNMRALVVVLDGFIQEDWMMLSKHALPQMLEYALHHGKDIPTSYFLTLKCSRLSNLQVICDIRASKPRLQELLIFDALIEQNVEFLNWMLNTMRWRSVISKDFLCTDDMWQIIEPSVVDGRLVCDTIDIMPPQMVALKLPTMSVDVRQAAFYRNIQKLEHAALLWMPEFDFGQEWFFNIDINKNQFSGNLATRKANCVHVDKPPRDMAKCEEALQFARTSQINLAFNDALSRHISHFLFHNHSKQEREWVFNRCCIFGTPRIAQKIWVESSQDEQEQSLTTGLLYSIYCANSEMLDFAFARIPRELIADWYFDAYLGNNIAVWRALASKNWLFGFLDFRKLSIIGEKSVEFLALLWPVHEAYFVSIADELLQCALEASNEPVLRFLTVHESFPMNEKLLCRHIVALSRMGIIDAINKIKVMQHVDCYELCKAYVAARDVTVAQTLFRVFNVSLSSEYFKCCPPLNHVDVDLYVFFIQNKFITFDTFYRVFVVGHEAQFEPIVARFYADIDFSQT